MPTHKPYTEISSLPGSGGVRRIKEYHLDRHAEALANQLEALCRFLFSAGGIAEAGTVTLTGFDFQVQNRLGLTLDALAPVRIIDETLTLPDSPATGTKCRVVMAAFPQLASPADSYTDPTTSEVVSQPMSVGLGGLLFVEGDTTNYPAIPNGAAPVAQLTRTSTGYTLDLIENTPPAFRW